jgi:hypothetical protein
MKFQSALTPWKRVKTGEIWRIVQLGIFIAICMSLSHQNENLPRKLQVAITIIDSLGQIYISWQEPAYIVLELSSQDGDTTTTFFGIEHNVSGTLSELLSTPLKTPCRNVSEDKISNIHHIPPLSPRQPSNRSLLGFQCW